MDEILSEIYTDVANEFINEGVVNPDIFQTLEKLVEARDYVLDNAPQGINRTRVIIVANIEISRLSAIANTFPEDQLKAAKLSRQKKEEKKNA